jgi:hypothetical protein
MADLKISALTSATTPLAGTEVLPIVQSGTTKQVSVANLTAGRAISATQLTLTTGNLIVANGQGVDFSATPGTGTSELFADYEEGTWTPTWSVSGGTIAAVYNEGFYTKVGRQVFVGGYIAYGGSTTGTPTGALSIAGLPFTASTGYGQGGGKNSGGGSFSTNFWTLAPTVTYMTVAASGTSVTVGNGTYAGMSRGFSNSDQVYFFFSYFV